MFNKLLARLTGGATAPASTGNLELSVAALLVQAAKMDDEFAAPERAAIERILADRFGLSGDALEQLVAAGEHSSEHSSQLYYFTRTAVEQLSAEERIRMIEMLWEVAYADGVLHPDEDALLRRVAGLIFVSDRDRGAARLRVLQRLGIDR